MGELLSFISMLPPTVGIFMTFKVTQQGNKRTSNCRTARSGVTYLCDVSLSLISNGRLEMQNSRDVSTFALLVRF